MIYVADVSSIGVQHEQFNLSFIKLLQAAYPQVPIRFFADKSHSELHCKSLSQIEIENINIFSSRGGVKEFVRAYYQYRSLQKIVKKAETEKVSRLFVLLMHPFAQFLFKNFTKPQVEISIVMHGELESLKFNKHFVNKIWGWFLKSAMSHRLANVNYIILGQSIYQTLVKVLPAFAHQKALTLDHPYPFVQNPPRDRQANQILLSSLGVATVAKSSQHIFSVAEKAANLGLNSLSFHICGRVYRNMEPFINDHVHFRKDFGPLTRAELNTLMAKSDFAVFYYDNKHYSLCSSGAFWDAVNAEIPLLYLRNDYFDYYASLVGEIGVAFDTVEDLNDYILGLGHYGIDESKYAGFVDHLRRLKNDIMSTTVLTRQLQRLPSESFA
jgi:hypothetical protein